MSQTTKPPPLTVLVVDDEPQMRRLLTITLEAAGYRVIVAERGQEGLLLAAQHRPDIILLDLGLPDVTGQSVLKRLREWCATPVIVLTVQDAQAEKIAAFDHGADDYVTKPFHSGELLARMRAALRHSQGQGADVVFHRGDLEVDLAARIVRKRGQEVRLTPTEYALLRALVTQAGRVLTHRQLVTEVWGPGVTGETHALRVHIAHLREKIENDSSRPELIVTESGVGYRLVST
jgi:two-component system, OmpR family, KDP operon response regulator KdpE